MVSENYDPELRMIGSNKLPALSDDEQRHLIETEQAADLANQIQQYDAVENSDPRIAELASRATFQIKNLYAQAGIDLSTFKPPAIYKARHPHGDFYAGYRDRSHTIFLDKRARDFHDIVHELMHSFSKRYYAGEADGEDIFIDRASSGFETTGPHFIKNSRGGVLEECFITWIAIKISLQDQSSNISLEQLLAAPPNPKRANRLINNNSQKYYLAYKFMDQLLRADDLDLLKTFLKARFEYKERSGLYSDLRQKLGPEKLQLLLKPEFSEENMRQLFPPTEASPQTTRQKIAQQIKQLFSLSASNTD